MALSILETTRMLGIQHPITILHITDLHLLFSDARDTTDMQTLAADRIRCFPHAGASFAEIQEEIRKNPPDFVLLTGDIVDFPSEKNLETLRSFVDHLPCPYLYTPGNHDWSLPEAYQSRTQYETYMPRFAPFCQDTPSVQCRSVGDDLLLIGVDNSRDHVDEAQLAAVQTAIRAAKAQGKRILAAAHVPLYADTLIDDVVRVWRSPIVIGGKGRSDTTQAFCDLIGAQADAVLTGHVHFAHADILPGGCPQYITALAAEGHLRRMTIL